MEFMNATFYRLKDIEYRVHLLLYSFSAFLLPLLVGHPQIVVGVGVNAVLVLCAYYMDFKGALPVIMLPSVGVLARGLIFGPYTVYLLYMIPLIWLGNAVLVFTIKYLLNKVNRVISLAIGSVLKTMLLFSGAYLLVSLGIIPAAFLTTMGVMQLATALLGGGIALGIVQARKRFT